MPYPAPDLASRGAVGRFLTGLAYPLQGFRIVLTHPGTWKYLIAPMGLSLVALVAALYGSVQIVQMMMESRLAAADNVAEESALWIVSAFFYVLAFGLTMVFTYVLANLLAVPFNDRLSERVEEFTLGPIDESLGLGTIVTDLMQSVVHSALSLILWVFAMGGLLALNLVPGFGSLLSVVGTTIATAFFLSREMMDGAMSRRRLGYAHKIRVVRANRAVCLGFGLVASAFLWFPIVNILLMPMMVAGGTLLYCHLEARGLVPTRDGRGAFTDPRRR